MKNALITGGSSGIGLAAAEQLAARGYHIIIAARDPKKINEAVVRIQHHSPSVSVTGIPIDLTDFDSVKEFANRVKKEMPVIDVLALNAGLYTGSKYRMGVSGYEMMISSTHLGHFLLTHLLLGNVKAAEDPRIVVTSSGAYRAGGLDIKSFKKPKYAWLPFLGPLWGYGQSKLANILFTRELAKRLVDSNVSVNCFHPGGVNTGFLRNIPSIFAEPAKPFLISPEKAAETLVYLADSVDGAKTSGEYFFKKRIMKTTPLGRNELAAKRLWEESERIVGLAGNEAVT